ncbi:hypothetical protein TAMA11512_10130 [Selenomonas sp. TAMA-11512]|uniref:hypothetical protein n=1 Tax=Selenomonas sp. TAMA-11512 TaxID=3095337 RepID=UPI0030935D68|nr:hypothetical protein TAMA11512_10130 [Selenomonas sp. TAMA-11512]
MRIIARSIAVLWLLGVPFFISGCVDVGVEIPKLPKAEKPMLAFVKAHELVQRPSDYTAGDIQFLTKVLYELPATDGRRFLTQPSASRKQIVVAMEDPMPDIAPGDYIRVFGSIDENRLAERGDPLPLEVEAYEIRVPKWNALRKSKGLFMSDSGRVEIQFMAVEGAKDSLLIRSGSIAVAPDPSVVNTSVFDFAGMRMGLSGSIDDDGVGKFDYERGGSPIGSSFTLTFADQPGIAAFTTGALEMPEQYVSLVERTQTMQDDQDSGSDANIRRRRGLDPRGNSGGTDVNLIESGTSMTLRYQ